VISLLPTKLEGQKRATATLECNPHRSFHEHLGGFAKLKSAAVRKLDSSLPGNGKLGTEHARLISLFDRKSARPANDLRFLRNFSHSLNSPLDEQGG
jgi:hypothetical protein